MVYLGSAAMRTLELKIPPLVVGVLIAACMWLVSWAQPALAFTFALHRIVAVSLGLAGVAIAGWAIVSFGRASTTINPMKPDASSSLVTSGIYAFTRNPMYLGLLVALVGWVLFLSNALAFLLLPAFVVYMNRFQIEPEERALTTLFGHEFVAYTSRVRRWI